MAQYTYYAGIDLAGDNLNVKKGQRLPDRWQTASLVKWIREKFGQGAVVVRTGGVSRKDEFLAAAAAKGQGKG